MKKILMLCVLLVTMAVPRAWAFGHTTIITDKAGKNGAIQIPVVDGIDNKLLENNMNHILRDKAEKLAKAAGGNATVSYRITMNRPTLFSIVYEANGSRVLYDGVNIDTTTGKEAVTKDFFYTKDNFQKNVGESAYVFGEDGLLLSSGNYAPYGTKVPYNVLMSSINVAEGARFINSYKLTESAEDKTLYLHTGELVALYLNANPTTGFNWALSDGSKAAGVVMIGNSFYLPNNNRTGMTGSPGTNISFFGFSQPGVYKLTFNYERSWVKDAIKSKNYYFVVK
ncbi:MAG: protease inhibitor I42 family protein [Acidaminococcaceae bacterium]|jgi:predicted secreted protein|nr:protease inhibitor I42 family protein [Acidaminococcaceae bacterium]